MPVYNTAEYLDEAIQSILHQSFSDFEFIISDDGSNDWSKEIIKKYTSQDSRIIFLDNPKNRGICANLNDMVQIAKWEYIAIMESDDISLQDRFQVLINFLEKNPHVSLVGACVTYIDSAGSIFIEQVFPTRTGLVTTKDILSMAIITPTFIFRKELINLIWLFKYKYIWDYELYIRILSADLGWIFNINQSLVKKRIHWSSTYIKNWRNTLTELLTLRKEIIIQYKLWYIKYIQSHLLYIYLSLLNIIRDFLSRNKYYKKIYSIFRRYLNFGL